MRQYLVPSRYLLNPPDRANMSQVDKDADSALRDAVQNLAMIARSHLSQARAMQGDVPKLGRLCLLPAVSQLHYLDELEKLKFDVLHPTLNVGRIGTLKVPLLLGRAWLTGYF